MKYIYYKKVDKKLPNPDYQTKGSVAFDLYSRIDITIKPHTIQLVPTNLIIKVPKDYALLIASRSSTPIKKNLFVANGIGIIDQDYYGNDDEIKVEFYNFNNKAVQINKGERIAQALLVKVDILKLKHSNFIKTNNRGGFGSTQS